MWQSNFCRYRNNFSCIQFRIVLTPNFKIALLVCPWIEFFAPLYVWEVYGKEYLIIMELDL